ncbi:uncharacterized protein F4807DRAFT_444019 [Annulohypoxylon truncatum]|uniref:uncharacterized protein n=1 Tax=Annulohypoxylon truncatum TaxID=327061 RepID=UPI002008B3CA|nr:uncharacterized protein F4807DRAFT_444019 [Annulohypoxylon truncatum]KAI1205249.1 hypothetical protein F4807DRAFT_444019 [Annulohypoxylon truncatum]
MCAHIPPLLLHCNLPVPPYIPKPTIITASLAADPTFCNTSLPNASFAMETPNAPLRASCDRCRAQKLRCVPSSNTDSTAPCMRCLRLKTPVMCTFSQRLQMRRSRKNTNNSDSETRPTHRKEKEKPSLPGMGTFVLPGPPSPESHQSLHSPRIDTKDSTPETDGDTPMITPEQEIPDFWSHESALLPVGEPPEPVDGTLGSFPEYYNFDLANLDTPEFLSELIGASDAIPANVDFNFDIDKLTYENSANPLVDLSGLLAEMSSYGSQLLKLASWDRDNYPIGDAVLLCQRFHTILFGYAYSDATTAAQNKDMPTDLLIISCYLILTRIYSSIFGYLIEHIVRMRELHKSAHKELSPSLHYPFMGDMHSYRGLSLSQLRPVCVCRGWEPEKKVLSMLCNSLGGVEGLLRLPLDARVITQGEQEKSEGRDGTNDTQNEEEVEKPTMVLSELLLGSSHGHLCQDMKEQAQNLREKITKVNHLLA